MGDIRGSLENYSIGELYRTSDACCEEQGLVGSSESCGRAENRADGERGLGADPAEVAERHYGGWYVLLCVRLISKNRTYDMILGLVVYYRVGGMGV